MEVFVQPLRLGRSVTFAILPSPFVPDYPFPAKWSEPGFVPTDHDLMWKQLVNDIQGKQLWLAIWLDSGGEKHFTRRHHDEVECDRSFEGDLLEKLNNGWEVTGPPFVLDAPPPVDGWTETAEAWAVNLLPKMVTAAGL